MQKQRRLTKREKKGAQKSSRPKKVTGKLIGKPEMWFRADAVKEMNGRISVAYDLSGNENDATQTDEKGGPVLVVDIRNGLDHRELAQFVAFRSRTCR